MWESRPIGLGLEASAMSTESSHQPGASDEPSIQAESFSMLSEADGQALDAWLEARSRGLDAGPMPAGLAERTERVRRLLGLLDTDPAGGEPVPGDLSERTLEAIRTYQQRKRFSEQVQMLAGPSRTLGLDWRQLATAAAVFFLGAALLMPVMERQQADSRRLVGAGNLGRAGQAISQYAADNLGQMPRGAVRPGERWTQVGQPDAVQSGVVRSNSAHLFKLLKQQYASPGDLVCPENEFAHGFVITPEMMDWPTPGAVSFSYQNQYRAQMPRLDEVPDLALLADRNPLFEVHGDEIVFSPDTPLDARSRAHRGAGQNVLLGDGHVTWSISPMLNVRQDGEADNIWAVPGVEIYQGNELPADEMDNFLVP